MRKETLSKTALILIICICLVPETRGQEDDPCEEPAASWYDTKQEAAAACFSSHFTCLVDTNNRFYRCKRIFRENKRRFIWCPEGQVVAPGGVGCEPVDPEEADLVSSFSVTNTTPGFIPGDPINIVDVAVTNAADVEMKEATLAGFFVSTDGQFDGGDTPLGGAIGTPKLGPKERYEPGARTFTTPALPAGIYSLLLVANYTFVGDEEDFDNNVSAWSFEIVDPEKPDLVATLETSAPEPIVVYPGQDLPTTLALGNASDSKSYDALVIGGIFLSEDETLDESDEPLAATGSFAGLQPSQSETLQQHITIPEDTPSGDYYLLGVVNPANYFAVQRGESPEPVEKEYDNNIAEALDITVENPKIEIEICVGNPISTNSGRKIETEVDYRGTGPFPFQFARFYSSRAGNTEGWRTSYSRHLYINERPDGTTDVILEFDNGARYEFEDIDTRGYSDPDVPGLMTRTASGFAYLDEASTIHEFDSSGRLTGLISRDGFTQTLTYANDRLIKVTGPFGRRIALDYDADGHVTSLQTPGGELYRYTYDASGLLDSVIVPDDTPDDPGDNPRRRYLYESPHLAHGLTGVIDENGHRFSTFDYDEQGRAILSSHDGGADLNTIVYGEDETTVTGPLGKNTTYVFEEILGTKRLARVDGHAAVNCPATQTTNTYDARGSVIEEVDPNGNVTQYTYTHTGLPTDTYLYHVGLVTRRVEAAGTADARTTTIDWHHEFRLPVRITEPGRTIELTWDSTGRLIKREEIAPDTDQRRTTGYRYDDQGLLIEIDGPRTDLDDRTFLAYNDTGDITAVTNALGHVTGILAHDADGAPQTIRDANGLVTHLAYDARNRLTSIATDSDAGIASTHVAYDAKGNVISIQLPDGQTLRYTYDLADRLTEIENDLGETMTFALDADGNRTSDVTRDAGGNIARVQQRAFDELSRIIATIGAAGQTSRFGYDLNGNLDTIEDALGRPTDIRFDGLNRLIAMTDALNGETTFSYDARDNLTSVTDAEGVTTTYTYDGLDNLVEENSTASGVTQHRYDAAGNRIETIDANSVVMHYSYDALNRLIAIQYPASPGENIAYHYDEGENGIGRLTAIKDPSGDTAFAYDQRGNLVTDRRTIAGIAYTTRYNYNLANQLLKIVYPSGRIVHYELDSLSRVAAIATQTTAASPLQPVASDFGYLPYGPATGWQHGNGLATRIGYDQDYRITDIDVADLDTIMSLTYQYNDVSNITRMLDNLGSNSQQFDYDALNRLTSASGAYGEIDYTYDGVGNRLSRTIDQNGEKTAEHYDYQAGSHRIDRVTTTDEAGTDTRQFVHDANGNIVSDNSAERQLDIAVNARNRMAAVYKDGEQVGEYEYNALGQRVAKTARYRGRLHAHFDQGRDSVIPSAAGGPQSGNTNGKSQGKSNSKKGQSDGSSTGTTENTNGLHSHYDNKPVTERLHFHYDQSGNLIAESDDKGNVIREYIYLGNYRIAMAATSLDRPSVDPVKSVSPSTRNTVILSASEGSRRRNNSLALYFIHNDHLGTPMKVTDARQRIVWSMAQTPFGEVALATEGIRMPMRFPGQYADIESGFSYNYFRDYDPKLGRYVQSDPIGLGGGLNTFSYADSQPVKFNDLRGLRIVGQPGVAAGNPLLNRREVTARDVSVAAGLVADVSVVVTVACTVCAPISAPIASGATVTVVVADFINGDYDLMLVTGGSALLGEIVSYVLAKKLPGIKHGDVREFADDVAERIATIVGIGLTIPANLGRKALEYSGERCDQY